MRAEHATVADLTDLLVYVAEDVSLRFDRWDDRYTRGPSLYFVVVSGVRFDAYADPLGDNRWPVEEARLLTEEFEAVTDAARDVAFERDGAVLVTADGTFQERMVRVRGADDREAIGVEYPDWMSTKHLSALEASTRDEVLRAVTLSEEDGRVTVFADGAFDDHPRGTLGGRWRTSDQGGAATEGTR